MISRSWTTWPTSAHVIVRITRSEMCLRLLLKAMLILLTTSCLRSVDVRGLPKHISINESGSHVAFEGRWRALSQPGYAVIPRINATQGSCSRGTMTCTETIAKLFRPDDKTPQGGSWLWADHYAYKVIEWSSTLIHARDEAPVNDIELWIYLADRSAERRSRETKARGGGISGTADPDISRHWILE